MSDNDDSNEKVSNEKVIARALQRIAWALEGINQVLWASSREEAQDERRILIDSRTRSVGVAEVEIVGGGLSQPVNVSGSVEVSGDVTTYEPNEY
jgi:hypothetical protein